MTDNNTPDEDDHEQVVELGTLILGTYEIKELINRGGMGEVYRAVNIHGGETVAIKIILSNQANDKKILALFIKEAKMLQSVNHDAIVGYTLFTKDPTLGLHCLIMEFVDGQSFGDHLDEGPMKEADVKTFIRRLASGLERAHQGGIIHRDLSPDNVIFRGGVVRRAKIIDFGIAKSSGNVGGGTLLEGQFAGKYGFVSPEQLGDFGGVVDGRSDIYSLGLLSAAACLGKTLDMGNAAADAVISRRNMPDLSGVYEGLRPLITLMLQPDPKHRPADMGEVLDLLENPDRIEPAVLPPSTDAAPDKTVIASSLPVGDLPAKPGSAPQFAATSPPEFTTRPKGEVSQVEDSSPFGDGPVRPEPVVPQSTPAPRSPVTKNKMPLILGGAAVVAIGAAALFFMGQGSDDTAEEIAISLPEPAPEPEPIEPTEPTPEPAAEPVPEVAQIAPEPPVSEPVAQPEPEPVEAEPDTPESEPVPTVPAETPPLLDVRPQPKPESLAQGSLDGFGQKMAWLQNYDSGECTYLALSSVNETGLAVEGFGLDAGPFEKLLNDYTNQFGEDLDIGVRVINGDQCAVLDLVARYSSSDAPAAQLRLENDVLSSGDIVRGTLTGADGRPVWLSLIDVSGAVINLSARLKVQADGTDGFSFRARIPEGMESAQYMILALTSDDPLTATQAAPNGVISRQLMPLVEQEIIARGLTVTSALRFFRLDR